MFFLKNTVYVIAEADANHNGSLDKAKKLIKIAKDCGADAINFNTSNLSEADIFELKLLAEKIQIGFILTPIDNESVDLLEKIGVEAYKISSCDLTNYPLLAKIATKKKPVMLSSGMASIEEVEFSINTIRSLCNHQIILFHCLSNYPAREEDCNLKAIKTLADKFNIPTGWSDHTNSDITAIIAVTLGAKIIKKYFDINSEENLAKYINNIRLAEKALGDGVKRIMSSEIAIASSEKPSLTASKDIKTGEIFSLDNITAKKPANGISPMKIFDLLGKPAKSNISSNTQISYDMVG